MAQEAGPPRASPFLDPGAFSQPSSLVILQLKRDLLLATTLGDEDEKTDGYDEGPVTNTRFGSFPHSTLVGLPWGSQVRASKVDTGSRGRRKPESKKRKRNDDLTQEGEEGEETKADVKKPVVADTGFVHLLPPTPEFWTASLPHRTQVVYTPDYSYILHRLRVRPGDVVIEAGAGSGSFTHAVARSVSGPAKGHVFSYEFHEQRVEKIRAEVKEHGLDTVVEVCGRDVCEQGFCTQGDMEVSAIFLDLPAPWLALAHLTRAGRTVLDPKQTVRLCTFSPCIEQVQRTVTVMRQLGWVEIEMTELSHKRIEVRREKLNLEETRGAQASPSSVDDALVRLRDIESRFRQFHGENVKRQDAVSTKGRKLYKEGRLTHKPESEFRTHTSYLVFAVLPREWSEQDEQRLR